MDEKSHHLLSKEIVWKDHLFGQIETVFLTHDLELPPTQHASHHQDYYNPENQQWHWKIPMFNSKTSSFMVDFPASHVNFQGGKPVFATSIQTMMGFLLTKKKSGSCKSSTTSPGFTLSPSSPINTWLSYPQMCLCLPRRHTENPGSKNPQPNTVRTLMV